MVGTIIIAIIEGIIKVDTITKVVYIIITTMVDNKQVVKLVFTVEDNTRAIDTQAIIIPLSLVIEQVTIDQEKIRFLIKASLRFFLCIPGSTTH